MQLLNISYSVSDFIPFKMDQKAGLEFFEEMKNIEGNILINRHRFYSTLINKPMLLQYSVLLDAMYYFKFEDLEKKERIP